MDGTDDTVTLDAFTTEALDAMDPATRGHDMADLKSQGFNYIAPPLFALVTLNPEGKITPSAYATAAKDAGLNIITWSLERSGPLATGGGSYYQTITPAVTSDGAMYELVDVLAQQVGVVGIFSDWPGTVTYYANCVGLE